MTPVDLIVYTGLGALLFGSDGMRDSHITEP